MTPSKDRERTGQECDAVIHQRNGSYGPFEIKPGGDSLMEEGVKSLIAPKEKNDAAKMKTPAFPIVLCNLTKYPYPRQDGVYAVPIGCLKDQRTDRFLEAYRKKDILFLKSPSERSDGSFLAPGSFNKRTWDADSLFSVPSSSGFSVSGNSLFSQSENLFFFIRSDFL